MQCCSITTMSSILPLSGPHSSRMVTQERKRLLQEQYYFLCQCEACSLQQEEEDEDGTEDRQQWSGIGGSQHKPALLCVRCKGSLKVSVH